MARNTNDLPGSGNVSSNINRHRASSTSGVSEDFEGLCCDQDIDCSEEEFKANMRSAICQMMFVSGETGEPSTETTTMIEGIVQQQVVEMVSLRFPFQSRA